MNVHVYVYTVLLPSPLPSIMYASLLHYLEYMYEKKEKIDYDEFNSRPPR